MKLHELAPNPGARRASRRLGRGHGSGRGKTAGRGTKGQKARAGGNIHPRFEGGQLPFIKRLPFKRGIRNLVLDRTPVAAINVGELERFAPGTVVTAETLTQAGLLRSPDEQYKVLATGDLTHALEVHARAFSAAAKAKIEAAGGTVVEAAQEQA